MAGLAPCPSSAKAGTQTANSAARHPFRTWLMGLVMDRLLIIRGSFGEPPHPSKFLNAIYCRCWFDATRLVEPQEGEQIVTPHPFFWQEDSQPAYICIP